MNKTKDIKISVEHSLRGFCSLNSEIISIRDYKILIRNDEHFRSNPSNVFIISGGGSGHEPGHNGYVGQGLLSAAVCGDIFTSPSVKSCLASILLAGCKEREILLIINNYTGDRLNFGLAVEMARNQHGFKNIKMLVMDDDCSLDNVSASTGRRGLAGVCFMHKIAGAMSTMGNSLDKIYEICSGILERREIRTIGFVFNHHITSNRIENIEIGYGIHGEPGSILIDNDVNFNRIISIMAEKLRLKSMIGRNVILLFNNLGGASEYVFHQFIYEFIEFVKVNMGIVAKSEGGGGGEEDGINVRKVYVGKFLTSLKKEGLSVSLMELNDPKLMEFLDFVVDCPFGHLFNTCYNLTTELQVAEFQIPQMTPSHNNRQHQQQLQQQLEMTTSTKTIDLIRKAIQTSIDTVMDMKDYLNKIDGELGDGDTGTTISQAVILLERELNSDNVILSNPQQMLAQISEIFNEGMGGTSGAIFSIFFQCSSQAFSTADSGSQFHQHTIENWTKSISMGIEGIMKHGKSNIGDRTLVDALHSGLNAIKKKSKANLSVRDFTELFAEGCENGAEATKRMRPRCGRSSYSLCDRGEEFEFQSSLPDPGAYAVQCITRAIADTFAK